MHILRGIHSPSDLKSNELAKMLLSTKFVVRLSYASNYLFQSYLQDERMTPVLRIQAHYIKVLSIQSLECSDPPPPPSRLQRSWR